MRYRIKKSDLLLVIETVRYLQANQNEKLIMLEACAAAKPVDMDMYPKKHTDTAGRMMDYGKQKSDSHEGRMTKAKLFRLAQMAQRLHDKIFDADDLPEWVQDKITTSEDRLQSAHDYITYKLHRLNTKGN